MDLKTTTGLDETISLAFGNAISVFGMLKSLQNRLQGISQSDP